MLVSETDLYFYGYKFAAEIDKCCHIEKNIKYQIERQTTSNNFRLKP